MVGTSLENFSNKKPLWFQEQLGISYKHQTISFRLHEVCDRENSWSVNISEWIGHLRPCKSVCPQILS